MESSTAEGVLSWVRMISRVCGRTERTFRNSEKQSIEATMTFPVPVDATLCALSARIEGRTLNAIA